MQHVSIAVGVLLCTRWGSCMHALLMTVKGLPVHSAGVQVLCWCRLVSPGWMCVKSNVCFVSTFSACAQVVQRKGAGALMQVMREDSRTEVPQIEQRVSCMGAAEEAACLGPEEDGAGRSRLVRPIWLHASWW